MLNRSILACALAVAVGQANAVTDLDALRAEIRQMRESYEKRLAELEARLKQAETQADQAAAKAEVAQEDAQTAVQASTPSAAPNSFNPEIALILDGRYAHLRDIPNRHLSGFLPLGSEPEGLNRGFSVDATELSIAADIDPYFRGFANIVYEDEGVDVEEAYFQTLGLGHGFTLKGGRFRSALGYMNEQHPHMWDFVDNPLMYQAQFGEGYIQDGLQAKWVAPTDLLIELTGDLGRGANFPGTDRDVNGANAYTLGLHFGGDLGDSHSWRTGLSYLHTRAADREFFGTDPGDGDVTGAFTGRSKTWMADLVWKWAPHGNPRDTNFKFQAEWFRRQESGTLTCSSVDPLRSCFGDPSGSYASNQSGWYLQGVYQFRPYWRLGYRYDQLDRGSADFNGSDVGNAIASLADYDPHRHSLMLDYAPSEFSLLRLQYARDESMRGHTEDQVSLQYIYSLGTHGAHTF